MPLSNVNWKISDAQVFWGEIAPTDHVVQIYDNEEVFIDTLAGYVGGGISTSDSVILIATQKHLASIERRLESFGIHVFHLIADNRYIPLDAEETLSKFMVNGWPDEELFLKTIASVLEKAKQNDRKIRAFGEMVALLWEQGLSGATVQLEHLWNNLAEREDFCLFCAYPKSGFTQDPVEAVKEICCTHSKVINGSIPSLKEILYIAS
jgi:hypothetical protein